MARTLLLLALALHLAGVALAAIGELRPFPFVSRSGALVLAAAWAGELVTLIVLGVTAAAFPLRTGPEYLLVLGWFVLTLHLVLWFRSVHKHYERVGEQLSLNSWRPEERTHNTVVVPISGVHRAVLQALQYAKMLSPDVRAVYVGVDPRVTANVRREWERWGEGVPLVVLQSAYRSLMEPLLEYIEQVDAERPDDFVTIVLPEFVPARWWHHLLHNQRALLIKGALLFKPNTVVTSVPFHLRK